jgi:CheY-like chemotaxis protein
MNLHLDEIMDASNRVAALTSQLLSFANRQTISLRVMDMNKAIIGIEEMLQRTVGDDIHVTVQAADEPVYAKIDPAQIEQVIVHMAVNSRDAMPNGGQLTIEASSVKLSSAEAVQLQDGATEENILAGDFAVLTVSDSGCGMTDEIKARVFEPFFTTKGTSRSTGLGLSTVYGMIKRHGGHITLYSNINRGTTFTIYLPVAEPSDAERSEVPQPSHIPTGNETILIAEDNPLVRRVLVGIVQKLGYDVLEAESGKQAIELAKGAGPVHMLLSDIIMPEMDGKTLADKIKQLRPEIKILFASGYPRTHLKEHGVLKDSDILISKPFSEEPVARAIRCVLDVDAAAA